MAWYDDVLNWLGMGAGERSGERPRTRRRGSGVAGGVGGVGGETPVAGQPPARASDAYAAMYPAYEITAPQYPTPSPYNLANVGYRVNEIVYACIQKRAVAVSEAQLRVYDGLDSRVRKELDAHPLRQLIRRPNPAMSEPDFWQATEIYRCIAGFACWEIELTNGGQPIALWPMRPDWCSFLRGPGQPLRAVRYQPYGLPPVDIPYERVLTFMEFDPTNPMLKGLSKTAVALKTIMTDKNVTEFLTTFFQRGAVISGVLKTQQALSEAEAARIRNRWNEQHGNGVSNWGDIAVLGSGVDFSPTQMTFQEMDFDNIDGRDEARICQVMDVPSILIGAKIGLNASTYSNYEQARKAFYENTIFPLWRWIEGNIDNQLMPLYARNARDERDERDSFPAFDVRDVRALQEDRTAKWTRAKDAAAQNLITRDEARTEMGLDAIDNVAVFVGSQPPAVGEATMTAEERVELEADGGDDADAGAESDNGDEFDDPDTDTDGLDIAEPEDDEAEGEADALLQEAGRAGTANTANTAKAAPRDADGDGIVNEGAQRKPAGRDNSLAGFMARRRIKPGRRKRKGRGKPKKTEEQKEAERKERRAGQVAKRVAALEGKRDELRQALIALQGQDDPSNLRLRISRAIERLEKRIERWKNDDGDDSGAGGLLREAVGRAGASGGASDSHDRAGKAAASTASAIEVAQLFADWRKSAIAALKAGRPIAVNDAHPELSEALAGCKTAGEVRDVFEEFWPKDDARAHGNAHARVVGELVQELHALRVMWEHAAKEGVYAERDVDQSVGSAGR